MIPQAEFHLSSNNDAHHISRPRPLAPSFVPSVGRAGAMSMSPQPGGGHHFISATDEISEERRGGRQ